MIIINNFKKKWEFLLYNLFFILNFLRLLYFYNIFPYFSLCKVGKKKVLIQ